jgi:hypothetical protein
MLHVLKIVVCLPHQTTPKTKQMKNSTIALESSNASFAYRIVRNPNGVLASNGKDHEWELQVNHGTGFEFQMSYNFPETARKSIQRGVRYADELWGKLGYQM